MSILKGSRMHIHAFKTGTIRTKCHYRTATGRSRIMRLASVLFDRTFCDLPVYAWAIEHPEGLIVIDTGLTAQMTLPEYFPALQRIYWQTQYRFLVAPEEEIGPQMQARGLSPADVRWVILTHAHFDHTQALYYFKHAEIVFYGDEYEDVQKYRSAHFDFPSKWPEGLNIRLIDYLPEPVGPFASSFALTQAKDLRLVPTPGHTSTHQSVILQDEGMTYFFAGDASFDLAGLQDGTVDVPAVSAAQTLETRQKIVELARSTPLVYLPTHDPAVESRLQQRTPVFTATTPYVYETVGT